MSHSVQHHETMIMQPSIPRTRPAVQVPLLACDCHTHVFGPHDRFPMWSGRSYSPPEASIAELLRVHEALGMQRVVIVHPSIYGTDNRVTLDALRHLGDRARGVAVVEDDVDQDTLAALDAGGMRGVRINLMMATEPPVDRTAALLRRMAATLQPFGWHIQLFARLGMLAQLAPTLAALPVVVSLDHFGGAQANDDAGTAGISVLCELLRDGNVYLKLSGAHRAAAGGVADPALETIARRLISANPRRLVWGTDWPHPGAFMPGVQPGAVSPLHDIDDKLGVDALARWAGDAANLRLILVDNPAALYGFASPERPAP